MIPWLSLGDLRFLFVPVPVLAFSIYHPSAEFSGDGNLRITMHHVGGMRDWNWKGCKLRMEM